MTYFFINADKDAYIKYYELAMDGKLEVDGIIPMDNALCVPLYKTKLMTKAGSCSTTTSRTSLDYSTRMTGAETVGFFLMLIK